MLDDIVAEHVDALAAVVNDVLSAMLIASKIEFEFPDVEFDVLVVLPDDDPIDAVLEFLDVDVVEAHLVQLLDDDDV